MREPSQPWGQQRCSRSRSGASKPNYNHEQNKTGTALDATITPQQKKAIWGIVAEIKGAYLDHI
jgi:hypothetical protein